MARMLSLSLFMVFLLAVTSQLTVSQAHIVRRSAEADPSDYLLADDAHDDTQNDADNQDGENEDADPKAEDMVVQSPGENFLVTLGQTVRLPCKVSSDSAVVLWSKDGKDYALNGMRQEAPESVTIEGKSDLIVHNINTTDLGTYVCSFPGISNQTVVHTIRLKEPPKIISVKAVEGLILVEGMNLTITCDAVGVPKPTLIWSKELSETENNKLSPERAQFGTNNVTLRNLKRSDGGTYICYATNDVGKAAAERISVQVLGKPRVHVHREAINSAPNIEAILECTVHEQPPANIHWRKDGKMIADNDPKYVIVTVEQNSTLTVTPKTAEEFGVFTCEAENIYGIHKRSIKLVQIPLIDNLGPINGTTFSWAITSHLPLEQIEMKIMEKKEEKWGNVTIPVPEAKNHTYYVEYTLDIASHRPGNYSAQLEARNSADWGESQKVQDIELVDREYVPESIQGASVLGGDGAIRPVTAMYTTLCLCLLTRIL